MVVKKAGTPISAKKKTVEEMKKLSEKKKKIMMKQESEEEEEDDSSDEEEEGEFSEVDDDDSEEESEVDANKSSGDDDDEEEEDESDDDDDDEEEEEDESEEDTTIALPKKQAKDQTPAKSAKTPSKQSFLTSPQKNEVQSSKKIPNKKRSLIQNDSSGITSSKKAAKTGDDSAKTPARQQKDTSMVKTSLEKRKREGGEEEGSPKKPRTDAPVNASSYSEEKRQRDLRCLFVKQFPDDMKENDLKSLSPEILAVRILGRGKRPKFAFLEFANEATAEENYHVIEKTKIKGQKLYVDYVGEKSKNYQPQTKQPRPENKKRLFVSGLPTTATMEDIGKHFPNAMSIFMKPSGSSRFAHIDFETETAGEEALKQNASLKIKGQPITVMYGFANKSNRRKPTKRKVPKGQQQSMVRANQKTGKKRKEEDDEDESEDDDDDNESDDEESEDDDDDDSDE